MPEALATKAVQEMQAPSHVIAAPAALAGQPDFNAIVNDFDEQWRVYFKRGKIPFVPPPSPKQLTNRVDASEAQIDSLEAELASLKSDASNQSDWEEEPNSAIGPRIQNLWALALETYGDVLADNAIASEMVRPYAGIAGVGDARSATAFHSRVPDL